MSDHTFVVIILVVAVLIAVRTIAKLGGGSLMVLRGTLARAARPPERDMSQIARYWERSARSDDALDDRTWSDLDMDAVFATVDHTESGVGQQMLYARMRAGDADPIAWQRFDAAVSRLGEARRTR